MPDIYNSDLGQNTRKAQPTSLLGTRTLKFISIDLDYDLFTDNSSTYDGYLESGTMYSSIVRCLQEVAELYYISAPTAFTTNAIIIGIASDTAQWQYSDEGNIDYNEIGWDETEPSHTLSGVTTMRGWPRRYTLNNDSAINDIVDRLYYFFRDTPIGTAFTVRALENTGFGLMPGLYLFG